MDYNNIVFLMKFLLSKKALNHSQKHRVSKLLARDAMLIQQALIQPPQKTVNNSDKENGTIKNENTSVDSTLYKRYKPKVIDTETIYKFLHLFGEKDALKYTTHLWDLKKDEDSYIFENYDIFKKSYSHILNVWRNRIVDLGNGKLWMLIQNFLLNDDAVYHWSEFQIKVGYNKYLEQWMKNNPGERPSSMPLSEFPKDIRPDVVDNRSLETFYDVINIFKKCIEFRDQDFFWAVKKAFRNKLFNVDKEKLSDLVGITFYTHTQNVKEALKRIAENIFAREDFPNIEISCKKEDHDYGESIRLEILQVGSYSYRDINDKKVLGLDPNGTFYYLKELLSNLCDLAVESKFKCEGLLQPLHIDYLTSYKNIQEGVRIIPEKDCSGFKYILTFHTYKINDE